MLLEPALGCLGRIKKALQLASIESLLEAALVLAHRTWIEDREGSNGVMGWSP